MYAIRVAWSVTDQRRPQGPDRPLEEELEKSEKGATQSAFEELARAREDATMLGCVSGGAGIASARAATRNARAKEIEAMVSRMVDAIPVDRWAVTVELHVVRGMSVTVVAREMGVSRSTVYSYLSRAADWADSNMPQQ